MDGSGDLPPSLLTKLYPLNTPKKIENKQIQQEKTVKENENSNIYSIR